MSTFTPGPWMIDNKTSVYKFNESGTNVFWAQIQGGMTDGKSETKTSQEELEANANLICAAPDLLEALEAMVVTYEYEASMDNPSLLAARSAIARAKGEAQ